jgi:hypothetical protein
MAAPAGCVAHDPIITFKLENTKPVNLIDLTGALVAFEECYRNYVTLAGYDVDPRTVSLFVREFGAGRIIADLTSMADPASPALSQLETGAGFVSHFDKMIGFFQVLAAVGADVPTAREAVQVISIMEPVAKDRAAYLHLYANGELDVRRPYDSRQAQAVQKMARRFLGADGENEIPSEELLSLFEIRGEAPAKAGDRRLFLVDAELKSQNGKVRLYRVLKVRDVVSRS